LVTIASHLSFLCRPFRGKRPSREEWRDLIDNLAKLHRQRPIDLVLVDPLSQFLAGAENSTPAIMDSLLPLQALAEAGPAVWLLHHPSKKKQPDGMTARGAVLDSFVDVLMEMSCYKGLRSLDRRRRLRAHSRNDETPRHLLIELNADGTDYLVHTNEAGQEPLRPWPALTPVLRPYTKYTRTEILKYWPEDFHKPHPDTLKRWLKRAFEEEVICREGSGLSGDPYRYWLPEGSPLANRPRPLKYFWDDEILAMYGPSKAAPDSGVGANAEAVSKEPTPATEASVDPAAEVPSAPAPADAPPPEAAHSEEPAAPPAPPAPEPPLTEWQRGLRRAMGME
jgi:hypothetical protein